MDAKILNNVLTKWIQSYIKRIIHHDQVGFISVLQDWFSSWTLINVMHLINRMKDKSHMIISIDAEKAFNKMRHAFKWNVFNQLEIEGNFNLIEGIYERLYS